jgi:hypothetical protein
MKGGITKLSELDIDANKDWQGHGVTNIAYLAAGMTRGSLLVHNGSALAAVPAWTIGDEFTSNGPGNVPEWKAPPG